MAKLISKTYGEALFETALDIQNVDGLYEEALALRQILKENQELNKLFNHPDIRKEEKLGVAEAVFAKAFSAEMNALIRIILEKGRQDFLMEILDWFVARVKEHKQIGIAYVSSAAELSDTQKKQMEEKLLATTTYESFEMNYSVDESLIGGLVIRIGDRVVDSSVKNRLYELKRELLKIQLG